MHFSTLGTRVIRRALLPAFTAVLATAGVAAANLGPSSAPAHGYVRYSDAGWVTSNNGTTLTIVDPRGKSKSYSESGTKYRYSNGTAATSAKVFPNEIVAVRAGAPATTGGHPTAKTVVISLASLGGLVKSNNGTTMTIADSQGFQRTISESGATCYHGRTKIACGSIPSNAIVAALGKVDPNGTTLDATKVREVAP